MNFSRFYLLLLVLFLGNCGYSFAQASHTQSSATVENKNSNQNFFDHFVWVNPNRSDINEVNFVGGYSFHSTRGFWGKIPQATLRLFALRYNRKLFNFYKHHTLEYVVEFNLADSYKLSDTPRYQADTFTGWGITPFGFQLNFWHHNLVQPFFKSSAGFMHFSKPFPDDRGVKFNFTLELGGGLELAVAKNLSFTLGYKYHHMSNGRFGDINPGIDSNVFYTGFTIF